MNAPFSFTRLVDFRKMKLSVIKYLNVPNVFSKGCDWLKHLLQPENSNLCGQTCVAMIAGVSLEESDRTFGTKGKTQFKQVTAALRAFGIECEDKLVRLPKDPNVELPETCIGVDWHPIPHTHWTLWYEGRFYDPSEFMKSFLEYDGRYHKEHGLVLLSYLDIRKARM